MRTLLSTLLLATAAHALPDYGEGSLIIPGDNPAEQKAPRAFPLKHTDVEAEISGFVARVKVTQTFQNPFTDAEAREQAAKQPLSSGHPETLHNGFIEAVYVFPLPDNAAVDAMTMKIGQRTVRGIIKKRDEARYAYEQAKAQGKAAALLDQERPNIFTQSVANIRPGEEIQIEIRYAGTLKYDNGGYEFHFPMVVGPRYIPGRALQGDSQGTGWAPDTERVPDASRITPPVLPKGMRSAHDIALRVRLDAGVPVQALRSPSHQILVNQSDPRRAEVALATADTIPNKDFVLRYDVAGERPAAGLLTTRGQRGGFFSLMIQPKAAIKDSEVTPRELVFVFDTSGSQMGAPLQKQKEIVRKALDGMRPGDTFQILDFNTRVTAFSEAPLACDAARVQRAKEYIESLQAGGGTLMLDAIQAVLRAPLDGQRLRMIMFLTDGYIGNDEQILGAIQAELGAARLFSFGIGSSVNRYLLERMGEIGRGVAEIVRPDENADAAVDRFYERIARPLLTDISVDWGRLEVDDVYPRKIPDLFSAQPVIVHGRYARPGRGAVVLRGRLAGQAFEQVLDVELPEREDDNQALGSVWARSRIEDRERQMYRGEKPEVVKEITELALDFGLVTRWTSFVAVEDRVINEGGVQRTVAVPVEMPQMVEHEGVFGESAGGSYGTIGLGGLGVMGSGRGRGGYGQLDLGGRGKVEARFGKVEAQSIAGPSLAPPPPARLSEAPDRFVDLSKRASEEQHVQRASRITLGEVQVAGALDVSAVKREIERQLAKLRALMPGAKGEITLRIATGADGQVSKVEVVRSTLAAADEKRLVEAVRRWRLVRAAAVLTVPLAFAR